MKKILMYVNSMNALGGIERVVANLSGHFVECFDVTILVKDKGISAYQLNERVKIDSINTELILDMNSRNKRIVSILFNYIKTKKSLRKYMKNKEFDVIYIATPLNGIEMFCASKSHRNRIVATEHASFYAYNIVYKKMKEWLYPRLKAIVVPTSMDTEIYRKLGYNAFYIPHLTTYSKTFDNDMNSKRIINVGRLTSDKQQMLLLDIWKEVYESSIDKEWKLQIIGSGEEYNSLQQKIQDERIKNVELIPHTNNINQYYENAELFVFTSKMEGFGMVLLEAMAFGVPCISFNCPSGPRDIIQDGINGYLIKCYNKHEYVNKVNEYMTMPYFSKKILSDNARHTVDDWDNDVLISKWKEVFNLLS